VTLTNGKPNTWASVALFISSVSPTGVVTVDFDGLEDRIVIRSRTGSVVLRNNGWLLISDQEDVDVRNGVAIHLSELGRRASLPFDWVAG